MSERILWLGGDQPRHLHYINGLKDLNIVGGIMQMRGNSIPERPKGLKSVDKINWSIHFKQRKEAEEKYFGVPGLPHIPLLVVDKETLNDTDSVEFVKKMKPDIALIFGTGMVREPLASALPKDTINLHLGLSPRYRGAATLFWPFYFLEPNFAGTTFHYIEQSPDAGSIIHQVVPKLERNDGIHDVACKAVLESTIQAVALIKKYPEWIKYPQKPEAGKNFLESDFKPQHLRMIYQVYKNDIVRAYLDGEIHPKEPKLRRQWTT
jgi:hypothetical protein